VSFDFDSLAQRLAVEIKGGVERGFPLAPLTTYRLGGPAAVYVEPSETGDLAAACRVLRDAAPGAPILALGRGSNLVVSDRGWPGVVIRLGPGAFSWIRPWGDASDSAGGHDDGLVAGASTSLPLLANWAARRSLSGLEFLIAIPGSVGGAVRMNAGAHGRDVATHLTGVRIFDIQRIEVEERAAGELGFAYRRSNLTERHLVLEAAFALDRADGAEVRARIDQYRRHRAATQPGAVQNAGSVFKNPPGDHAGRLVEAAGLKGYRVGGASVSELHANFFIADDGARAQDVFDLVKVIRARVKEVFDIELEPEIRFAGEFEAHSGATGARKEGR
jgi:UDP-N-acetylmuramate dehydrogenase